MDTDKYLERINYRGKTSPNLDNLKKIHKNHLFHVPFENLDIHFKREIILDKDRISEKVLNSSRGGYCYELNGLFYFLLKELGYNVKMISARVSNAKSRWGAEFDHLANVVELDELWLADVGFGDNFYEPLKIVLNKPQQNLNGWFKITENKSDDELNNYLKMSKSAENTAFSDEYIFTLTERKWNDFSEMNVYHQTSPESHFTQKKIVTIAKEKGRVTLSDNKLIITDRNSRNVKDIKNENDFTEKLFEYFKIKI